MSCDQRPAFTSVSDFVRELSPIPLDETPEPIEEEEPVENKPPLTRWRRKLAELHFRKGLHGALVHRKFYGSLRIIGEELFHVAALGLCLAAQSYEPKFRSPKTGKRVKFCSYAWRYMWGYVHTFANRRRKMAEAAGVNFVELDYKLFDGGVSEEEMYARCKRNLLGDYEAVDARIDSKKHMKKLTKREAEIVLDRLCGETLRDIADRMKLSKERVRQIETRACERIGIESTDGKVEEERTFDFVVAKIEAMIRSRGPLSISMISDSLSLSLSGARRHLTGNEKFFKTGVGSQTVWNVR